MKKIYYMLLIAVISMTFVSCDEHSVYWDTPDYRYIDNILGTWESYYGYDSYGEYDIRGYDIERFDFYGNYLGRYYYYSAMGWTYINFQWAASENKISIWYENGDFESMYWGINHYGDLVLSYDWKYREYTVEYDTGYVELVNAYPYTMVTPEEPTAAYVEPEPQTEYVPEDAEINLDETAEVDENGISEL